MEIIKEQDNINLYNDKNLIETYNFSKDIDFKELVKFLLNENLKCKYTIDKEFDDKTPEEEGLVSLVKDILNDYNTRVDEYNGFVKVQQEKNNNISVSKTQISASDF